MRTGEYHSKGKLLISGEYLVLHGAKALSVPLKLGQSMQVTKYNIPGIIRWETIVRNKPWFRANFHGPSMELTDSSHYQTALFVQKLLHTGKKIQPKLHIKDHGYHIVNEVEFDMNWGLGSSSSLLSNLAYWLDADLYSFYKMIFHGSGYDVFCARASKPMIYQLRDKHPHVEETAINPALTDSLYFIYLGHKQDSQESVRKFNEKELTDHNSIHEISSITESLTTASDPVQFMELMHDHERLISGIIGMPAVKEEYFNDFQGEIKSLGAWGGDFIMACSVQDPQEVAAYFRNKGLNVIFRYKELVN